MCPLFCQRGPGHSRIGIGAVVSAGEIGEAAGHRRAGGAVRPVTGDTVPADPDHGHDPDHRVDVHDPVLVLPANGMLIIPLSYLILSSHRPYCNKWFGFIT